MQRYLYPVAMRELVNEFSKLPSVGEKSATRLAYHLISTGGAEANTLARALVGACERIKLCKICFALTEESHCSVCLDSGRERNIICVVEKPTDIIALERSGRYSGLYHVLHGLWAPLKGVSPDDIKICELLKRIQDCAELEEPEHRVSELILATSATVEGDATALYIANSAVELDIEVTRIAQGLPKGGELEYADEMTLSHALEGRQRLT